MRRCFLLILVGAWLLAPCVVTAQTPSREKAIADFYWRTGLYQSALFYAQLEEKNQKKQTPKESPAPPSLEQLIAEALKNNPDIRVAEAKARESDAELARTRMKVVSDITFLQAEILAAQTMVDYAKKEFDRSQGQTGTIAERVTREAALALEKAKVDLAAKQAKLPYLLGKQSTGAAAGLIDEIIMKKFHGLTTDTKTTDEEFLRRLMLDLHGRPPTPEEMKKFMKMDGKDRRTKWVEEMVNPALNILSIGRDQGIERVHAEKIWKLYLLAADSPLTDKLRKALDATTSINEVDVVPGDVLEHVRDKMLPGINLVVRAKFKKGNINVRLGESVAVGAVLQFLEDELDIVFVLRDYGVVVIAADERTPPGAVRVVDFWKHGKTAEPAQEPKTKTPPPKAGPSRPVRGVIEQVDPKDPMLMQISVGSDGGVVKGQTLEIFRLGPEPRFVGRMEIVEVTASRSIGRLTSAVGNPQGGPRVADQVAPPPLK